MGWTGLQLQQDEQQQQQQQQEEQEEQQWLSMSDPLCIFVAFNLTHILLHYLTCHMALYPAWHPTYIYIYMF